MRAKIIRSGRAGSPPHRSPANHLLRQVGGAERAWLEHRWTRVPFGLKDVLYRQGEPIDRLYFPDSGVVSLISVMPSGKSAEVGTIGVEGAVGVHAMYEHSTMPCEALVQVAGEARVLRLQDLLEDGRIGGELPSLVCRYAHTLLLQTMQTAACNTLHTIRQRTARLILTLHDAAGADAFPLTQEQLGVMLGARRQSVNAVARSLRRARVIEYRHGTMVIRDRRRLEAVACPCYAIVCGQRAHLVPDVTGSDATAARDRSTLRCPCCGLHRKNPRDDGSVTDRTDRRLRRVAQ